jgi:5-formyltetrahydrofolate cyclo-ligase
MHDIKENLRHSFKSVGLNLTPLELTLLITNIITVLDRLNLDLVGLYYPLKAEPDIENFYQILAPKTLLLPKIKCQQLAFAIYHQGDKLLNKALGFFQPASDNMATPQIVIVPGIAFDVLGFRLGYGAGYYDRYFAKNNVIKIGVCFEQRLFYLLPKNDFDVKMDYIITESTILKIC